jgi:NodT family efflux transporter outer membrane factor (OMF) lipoprotein
MTVIGLALVLAGCAQLPGASAPPALRNAASYASAESFAAAPAAWPQERWWSAYGDGQLDTLVEEALAGAPDMAAAAARLQAAEALAGVAASANRPQLSANAALSSDKLSYNHLTPPEGTPRGWTDYGRATLDLRWELDFWGRNRAALAAANSARDAAQAELAQARLLLASSIAASYAELDRLYAGRDTAEKSVALRRKTAELFAERLAHGLENRGGAREAEARLAAAQGAVLAHDEQIAVQRNRLAALLGAGPDRGLRIARPALRLVGGFGLPEVAGAGLLGRRPDVTAARLLAQAQASRIDQKKAEFYPNVNLMAFVGVQSLGIDMLDNSGSSVGSVGPALSLPIFTGGRLRGELRGAQADYAQAVANYNGIVSRAMQEVADAAVRQRALGARLERAQQAVDASGEAWRVAQNRYQGGLASYLEVLVAEDGLLANMNTLTDLRSLSVIHDIAIKRALGGGYQAPQG